MDAEIIYEIWFDDIYGMAGLELNRKGAPVIIDIGANIGAFTALARETHTDAKIYSFEPQPENAAMFEQHIFPDNDTRLYRSAVYGTNRPSGLINHIPGNMGAWSTTAEPQENQRLDTVCFRHFLKTLDRVDILKLDCEGSEEDILLSLTEAELRKIKYIVGEFHPTLIQHDIGVLQRHLSKTHEGSWKQMFDEIGIFRLERHDTRGAHRKGHPANRKLRAVE